MWRAFGAQAFEVGVLIAAAAGFLIRPVAPAPADIAFVGAGARPAVTIS
jgi:hypothetical protein